MKPELGTDKPVAIVVQEKNEPRWKGKKNMKKWIVAAVAVLASLALIITGFSVTFYFYSNTASDMIKFRTTSNFGDGDTLNEEIDGFPKTGSIVFKKHFTTKESDQYEVVYNHNQKLAVAAILKTSLPVCVVHHLDVNITVQDVQEAVDGRRDFLPYTYHLTTNGSVVTDASFLPPEARQLCADVTVVWGWAQHTDIANISTQRQKRTSGRRWPPQPWPPYSWPPHPWPPHPWPPQPWPRPPGPPTPWPRPPGPQPPGPPTPWPRPPGPPQPWPRPPWPPRPSPCICLCMCRCYC